MERRRGHAGLVVGNVRVAGPGVGRLVGCHIQGRAHFHHVQGLNDPLNGQGVLGHDVGAGLDGDDHRDGVLELPGDRILEAEGGVHRVGELAEVHRVVIQAGILQAHVHHGRRAVGGHMDGGVLGALRHVEGDGIGGLTTVINEGDRSSMELDIIHRGGGLYLGFVVVQNKGVVLQGHIAVGLDDVQVIVPGELLGNVLGRVGGEVVARGVHGQAHQLRLQRDVHCHLLLAAHGGLPVVGLQALIVGRGRIVPGDIIPIGGPVGIHVGVAGQGGAGHAGQDHGRQAAGLVGRGHAGGRLDLFCPLVGGGGALELHVGVHIGLVGVVLVGNKAGIDGMAVVILVDLVVLGVVDVVAVNGSGDIVAHHVHRLQVQVHPDDVHVEQTAALQVGGGHAGICIADPGILADAGKVHIFDGIGAVLVVGRSGGAGAGGDQGAGGACGEHQVAHLNVSGHVEDEVIVLGILPQGG